MSRLAAVALAIAFSAGVAVAGLTRQGGLERPLVLRGTAPIAPLVGIHWGRGEPWLVRVDPRTLKILPGRRLGLLDHWGGWSYSPDRRLLAFGNRSSMAATYSPARVRLVDARRLRRLRDVSLGFDGDVLATHWAAPDRLLAVAHSAQRDSEGDSLVVVERVVVIDPRTGAILARRELDGHVSALARSSQALVLLLEGERWGPVRLAVAAADGSVRSVVLERIEAGSRVTQAGVPRHDGAAVAVDRNAGRAYVVAANCPVADIELGTLALVYHTPAQPVSLLGRLHDWLEPSAEAKGPLEGSSRSAVWLGDGRLAVFGRDTSTYGPSDDLAVREQPSGLRVIDTRTWNAQLLDPHSSALAVARDALLSWGLSWDSGRQLTAGTGLTIFDARGLRRFHLFGPRPVYDVQVVGSRAFVRKKTVDTRYSIVDIRAGRQVRTIRGREMPTVLTEEASPFFG